MDNMNNPLLGLTPAQLAERALDLRHEVDYWQTVLSDTGTIGDDLAAIVEQLLSSTVAAASTLALGDERVRHFAGEVLEANGKAMTVVLVCMRKVHGLIDLANGRGIALDRTIAAISEASGVPLDDADAEAER